MLRLCIIVLCFPPRNMYIVKTIVPALLSWIVGHFINQAGKQNTSEAQVTDLVWWEWNSELAKSLWGGQSLDWNKSFAKPRYLSKKQKKCASPTIWTLKIYIFKTYFIFFFDKNLSINFYIYNLVLFSLWFYSV